MDYEKSWNDLKNRLEETIINFNSLSDEYLTKEGSSTKTRVLQRKIKEYKKIYDLILEYEDK